MNIYIGDPSFHEALCANYRLTMQANSMDLERLMKEITKLRVNCAMADEEFTRNSHKTENIFVDHH